MIFIDEVKKDSSPYAKDWDTQWASDFKLKKDANFWLDERYKSIKTMTNLSGRGTKQMIPTYPPSVALLPYYDWVNPRTQETHKIQYVETTNTNTSAKTKSGHATISKLGPEYLFFDAGALDANKGGISGGMMICPKGKTDLYQWLSRHPLNKSNPIYWVKGEDGLEKENEATVSLITQGFTFFEDNRDKKAASDNKKRGLKVKAMIMLDEMSNDQKREMYAAYGQAHADTENINIIELYLGSESETNPADFLVKMTDAVAMLQALVNRAVEYKVVMYKKSIAAWVWVENNAEAICSVPRGIDPVATLVRFLKDKDVTEEVQKEIKAGIRLAMDGKAPEIKQAQKPEGKISNDELKPAILEIIGNYEEGIISADIAKELCEKFPGKTIDEMKKLAAPIISKLKTDKEIFGTQIQGSTGFVYTLHEVKIEEKVE